MSAWPATKAARVLAALRRIGWRRAGCKGSPSYRVLERAGWPNLEWVFGAGDEIGPRELARVARRTGLRVEHLSGGEGARDFADQKRCTMAQRTAPPRANVRGRAVELVKAGSELGRACGELVKVCIELAKDCAVLVTLLGSLLLVLPRCHCRGAEAQGAAASARTNTNPRPDTRVTDATWTEATAVDADRCRPGHSEEHAHAETCTAP
jgi:hypothetical protein